MFKVGVFMGWADLNRGDISWAVLVPTYIGACCWTITYETIYQHMVSPRALKVLLELKP